MNGLLILLTLSIVCAYQFSFIVGDKNVQSPLDINDDWHGWKSCGDASDIFVLEKFTVEPETLVRGEKFSVALKGTLLKDLDYEALVRYRVDLGEFTFIEDESKICDLLEKAEETPKCPIKSGEHDVYISKELPGYVFQGKYYVKVNGKLGGGEQIFCIEGRFEVS